MNLAFTGTQKGMTYKQQIALVYILSQIEQGLKKIHHGSCVGADKEFHDICCKVGMYDLIESHPCTIKNKRADCKAPIVHDPKPPLDRNQIMVNVSDLLIACPKEDIEQLRSGTWATFRYAKQNCKKIILIYPNGKYTKL